MCYCKSFLALTLVLLLPFPPHFAPNAPEDPHFRPFQNLLRRSFDERRCNSCRRGCKVPYISSLTFPDGQRSAQCPREGRPKSGQGHSSALNDDPKSLEQDQREGGKSKEENIEDLGTSMGPFVCPVGRDLDSPAEADPPTPDLELMLTLGVVKREEWDRNSSKVSLGRTDGIRRV